MPGMGRSLQTGNTLIVSSFHTALFHQLIVVLALGAVCAIGFNVFRTVQYQKLKAHGQTSFPSSRRRASARADGPSAPPDRLRRPLDPRRAATGPVLHAARTPLGRSPAGSQRVPGLGVHLVNSGVTIWSNHPIQAASATVWIQVGIGLWLLVAPRGRWSRFGGVASVGWGLVVWAFGEAFGGIFAPGATWLFGAPGAVLFYCAAGILIALPERAYRHSSSRPHRARTGRGVPDRHGRAPGLAGAGVLAGPRGDADRHGPHHGPDAATRLPLVVGRVLRELRQRPRLGGEPLRRRRPGNHRRPAAERPPPARSRRPDRAGAALRGRLGPRGRLGLPGGLGTDPNSMLPMALVSSPGYVAMVRVPVAAEVPDAATSAPPTAAQSDVGRRGCVVGEGVPCPTRSVRRRPSPRWRSSSWAPGRWRPPRSTGTPTPS